MISWGAASEEDVSFENETWLYSCIQSCSAAPARFVVTVRQKLIYDNLTGDVQ